MLLTREEMTFDFGDSKLDPVRDKETIEWVLNQCLYGEMTGIQVGHWLFHAPDVDAAKFLARQSLEEMQHVDNFLRMLQMMSMKAKPAHPVIRFLSTGMMGGSWEEHVAIEMASGEGFVLLAFYAIIDTLDHPESVAIMERAVKQEERHVDFGEQQTIKAIAGRPALKRRLLGLNLVSMWGVARVAGFMKDRFAADSEVAKHMPAFLDHANRCAEKRLLRMGILDRPVAELSRARQLALVAEAYGGKTAESVWGVLKKPLEFVPGFGNKRLTDTYLQDPYIANFSEANAAQARHRYSGS